jgi:hypothetical protein
MTRRRDFDVRCARGEKTPVSFIYFINSASAFYGAGRGLA